MVTSLRGSASSKAGPPSAASHPAVTGRVNPALRRKQYELLRRYEAEPGQFLNSPGSGLSQFLKGFQYNLAPHGQPTLPTRGDTPIRGGSKALGLGLALSMLGGAAVSGRKTRTGGRHPAHNAQSQYRHRS